MSLVRLEGREVGVGLGGGFGVRLALLVLDQRPVDAGQARVVALALAGGDDQVGADLLDGLAVRPAAERGVQHVVGDDRRPAAVLALAGIGVEPFEVASRMLSPLGLGHCGEESE
ncbi:hypothetical protein ABT272_41600 [Streptomyces sp900105245]|uniref:Uncharacterized protein n=1 Tax=Streptomyces sp. 900105245 TaxID=3154379 RepID=A0ABV1ULH7_9ACTN